MMALIRSCRDTGILENQSQKAMGIAELKYELKLSLNNARKQIDCQNGNLWKTTGLLTRSPSRKVSRKVWWVFGWNLREQNVTVFDAGRTYKRRMCSIRTIAVNIKVISESNTMISSDIKLQRCGIKIATMWYQLDDGVISRWQRNDINGIRCDINWWWCDDRLPIPNLQKW